MTEDGPGPRGGDDTGRREVRIAVTGHRSLADPGGVAADVDHAFDVIARWFRPDRLRVLSALAEGADRLVAERALARDDVDLVVVLPLPEEEYVEDFATPASRAEYRRLRGQAREVVRLPGAGSRDQAYARLGEWLVENGEILIAVWDGRPPRGLGGTGEVLARARAAGRHTFRIHPGEPTP